MDRLETVSVRNKRQSRNIASLIRNRELFKRSSSAIINEAYVNRSFIENLGLEGLLNEHDGCVNCLEWCDNGRFLLSGSDDKKAILWDPFTLRMRHIYNTRHYTNIFSVKKIESYNGPWLVTGAADAIIHCQPFDVQASDRDGVLCACHTGCIKKLETSSNEPNMLWSAAEDGLILQFDLRERHNCKEIGSTALVDLISMFGVPIEAKAICIHPSKSHLMAVGCDDPFVRVFDRRKIHLSNYKNRCIFGEDDVIRFRRFRDLADAPLVDGCVEFYAPTNLLSNDLLRKLSVTNISYNTTGTKMLVNIGSDHIYSYDVSKKQSHVDESSKTYAVDRYRNIAKYVNTDSAQQNIKSCSHCESNTKACLRPFVTKLSLFDIDHLNSEIAVNACFCKLLKRGLLFNKRNWLGDDYAALKDLLKVVPFRSNSKTLFLKIMDLFISLGWFDVASQWNSFISTKFPKVTTRSEHNNKVNKISINDEIKYNVPSLGEHMKMCSRDFENRYLGHCNVQTDIKEANYFGRNDEFVIAGSDGGHILFWDEKSTNIVDAINADTSNVNIVRPHSATCLLASSGIESTIKIWRPLSDPMKKDQYHLRNLNDAIKHNQDKLRYAGVDDFDEDVFRYVFDTRESSQICAPS